MSQALGQLVAGGWDSKGERDNYGGNGDKEGGEQQGKGKITMGEIGGREKRGAVRGKIGQ